MADQQESRYDRKRRSPAMLASALTPGPRGPPIGR
jgi:hypothetical protein